MEKLLGSPKAQDLLRDPKKLNRLLGSEEAARLVALFEKSAGGKLKEAAQSAVKGDPRQLREVMERVLKSREGSELARKLDQSTEGK